MSMSPALMFFVSRRRLPAMPRGSDQFHAPLTAEMMPFLPMHLSLGT